MLSLHDSMTGKVSPFVPSADKVSMYVCGPTVYGSIHVGNARPLVVFDILFRLLRHEHPDVVYVRNITDIDDKIIAAAAASGEEPAELATRYKHDFWANAKALNTLEPTMQPCATDHIDSMVRMIETLLAKNHAYIAEGHVLFDITSDKSYGKLARRKLDEMIEGARVEVAPYKKNAADFVLWKPSNETQPSWESPWGHGRPGWHLECSAMIETCLGGQIDIHGGGIDLVFPHHENENAQSCCAFGLAKLARFWLHNGHVTMEGDKMSKSQGNITKLTDLLASFPGEAIRYALLTTHYRSPLDWNSEKLVEGKNALDRLYRALGDSEETAVPPVDFLEALHNDLNTPKALACLHELGSRINRDGNNAAKLRAQLRGAGMLLGFFSQSAHQWFRETDRIDERQIEQMVEQRVQARNRGDYVKADQLRCELEQLGVQLEDTSEGTEWRTN